VTSDNGFVLIEALFLLMISIVLVHLTLSFCMSYVHYETVVDNVFQNKEMELIYER